MLRAPLRSAGSTFFSAWVRASSRNGMPEFNAAIV